MKTLPISEELLRDICRCFLTMEPGRDSLIASSLEASVYDQLLELYPQFMYLEVDDEDRKLLEKFIG